MIIFHHDIIILSEQTKLISRSITIIINNNNICQLYSLELTKNKATSIQSYRIDDHPMTQDKLYRLLWYNDNNNDNDDTSSITKNKYGIVHAFLKTPHVLHDAQHIFITFIISHITSLSFTREYLPGKNENNTSYKSNPLY